MENSLEYIKTIVVCSCFGAIVGIYLYWIGRGIVSGTKRIIRKIKKHKTEEAINE